MIEEYAREIVVVRAKIEAFEASGARSLHFCFADTMDAVRAAALDVIDDVIKTDNDKFRVVSGFNYAHQLDIWLHRRIEHDASRFVLEDGNVDTHPDVPPESDDESEDSRASSSSSSSSE
jgi:hypothetical protein